MGKSLQSGRLVSNSRIFVNSAGNIGIGTDNPGQTLTVQGTTSLMATNSTNQWMAYNHTDNTFRLNYNGTGADEVLITSDGKIGIGVDPANVLHIKNDSPTIRLESSATSYVGRNTIGQYQNGLYIDCDNDNAINNSFTAFSVDGTEKFRITSGGNIGINQNNPNKAKLHVVSEGNNVEEIVAKFRNSYSTAGGAIAKIGFVAGYSDTANNTEGHAYIGAVRGGNGNTSNLIFETFNGSSVGERLRITSGGSVTVNIDSEAAGSYTYKLLVSDNISSTEQTFGIQYPAVVTYGLNAESDGAFTIKRDGVERFRISTGGELYLGGSSTYNVIANYVNTAKLHLSGAGGGSANIELHGSNHTTPKIMTVSTNSGERLRIDANGDHHIKIGSGNYGGSLFVGENSNPTGNLPILRDTHQRPIVYVGGSYPEITLANQELSNARHGPTLRFTNYAQASNTAAGHQYVMGTNGTGTFFEISSYTASQNANAHDGIDGHPGATPGLTYTGMRIHNDGTVIKPRNCSFRAGRNSIHTPGANGTIIFNTTSNTGGHNVGNHYNTANGIFTAPQPGIYLFTVQVIWQNLGDGQAMDDCFHMMVNTTLAGYSGRRAEYVSGTTGNSAYFADHMVYQFKLAANDSVYVRNNRALTVHGNQNYTTFSGYLLG